MWNMYFQVFQFYCVTKDFYHVYYMFEWWIWNFLSADLCFHKVELILIKPWFNVSMVNNDHKTKTAWFKNNTDTDFHLCSNAKYRKYLFFMSKMSRWRNRNEVMLRVVNIEQKKFHTILLQNKVLENGSRYWSSSRKTNRVVFHKKHRPMKSIF